jgi:PAS domain S-box-containing protein
MSDSPSSLSPAQATPFAADSLCNRYFDDAPYMLALLEEGGKVVAVNRAALRLGRFVPEQIIGQPFWQTPWWQGERRSQALLIDALQKAKAGTVRIEATSGPLTLGLPLFDLTITPVGRPGMDALYLMVEGRDVTEARQIETAMRQSEQRLRDLVEGSLQGILVHRGNHILFANSAYAAMMGYASPLEVMSVSLTDIIAQHEWHKAQACWQRLDRGEHVPVIRAACNRRRDGTVIYTDILVRSIMWDGKAAVQATVIDVTAQLQAFEAEAARRAAEEASRAKSAFIATLGHELRTPLNAIIGFAEMIGQTPPMSGSADSPVVEYAHDIEAAGRHLLGMINDLLQLSKIEAGKIELECRWLSVAHELGQVARIAHGLAQGKGLSITLDTPDAAQAWRVFADERMLRQILLNIVGNAVKFTPEGGTVSMGALTLQDGGLEIWIKDTGVGIKAEDLPRIWAAFEQAGGKESRQRGTGLGLPIARAMAGLHQASLTVQSEPGVGSLFSLRFPASRTELALPLVAADAF